MTQEHPAELDAIRLVLIEDLVELAEQRGQDRVDLDVADIRWLIEFCKPAIKEALAGGVRPVEVESK